MAFCVVDVTAAVRFRIVKKKGGSVGNTLLLPRAKMLLVPKMFFFSPTGRLCSKGNVLTDQM